MNSVVRRKFILLGGAGIFLVGLLLALMTRVDIDLFENQAEGLVADPSEYDISPEETRRLVEEFGEDANIVRLKPLIEELSVDRRKVCPEEDVLIRATPAENSPLRYVIQGESGDRLVRRWSTPGSKQVFAVARGGQDAIDYRKIGIVVLNENDPECAGKPKGRLDAGTTIGMTDHVDIEARNIRGLQPPYEFIWDFGDGTSARTEVPFARHDYSTRDQNDYSSSFVVTLLVRDSAGNELPLRTSVTLTNVHFMTSLGGTLIIPVSYNRFPKEEKGLFRTKAHFTNIGKSELSFSAARVVPYSCKQGNSGQILEIPASQILDRTRFSGKRTEGAKLSLSRSQIGTGVCQARVSLIGEVDGREVRSELSLDLDMPEVATADGQYGAQRVQDEDLSEKIVKAARILGRAQVTPADLEKLEKEGKL